MMNACGEIVDLVRDDVEEALVIGCAIPGRVGVGRFAISALRGIFCEGVDTCAGY